MASSGGIFIFEQGLEFLSGVVQSAHHRAERAVHDAGNFLVRKPLHILEDHDLAVFVGKLAEGEFDFHAQFAIGERFVGGLVHFGRGRRGWIDAVSAEDVVVELARAFDAALAGPVVDRIVGDAVEPCRETGLGLEAWEGVPRFDEDLLGEVPCIGFVVDHVANHGEYATAVTGDQGIVCGEVPLLGLDDECPILVRSIGMGVRNPRSVRERAGVGRNFAGLIHLDLPEF